MENTTPEIKFFLNLKKLHTSDRCALKRCAGRPLSEANEKALVAFYRCEPLSLHVDELFNVACFASLWKPSVHQEKNPLAIEQIMRSILSGSNGTESLQNKFIRILDVSYGKDGYLIKMLNRYVLMAMKKGYLLDEYALYKDLVNWNNPNRYVQQKWARAIASVY